VTYENYIKAKIVDYAVAEAWHHGGIEGMQAVAQVLANRVQAGWGEWDAVLKTAPNYVGTILQPPDFSPRDINFRRMLGAIDDVYNGVSPDDSGVNIEDDRGKLPALYYAEIHNINRQWFIDNITSKIDRHPRIATVGPLTFFA